MCVMKFRKKQVMLLVVVALAILSVLFMRSVPLKTFYYQTSTACSSNLYGGGNTDYLKYTVLSGGLGGFNNEKSKLEDLNIPQSGCNGSGLAPEDVTTLELYLL
jgi:hypothetical protein